MTGPVDHPVWSALTSERALARMFSGAEIGREARAQADRLLEHTS